MFNYSIFSNKKARLITTFKLNGISFNTINYPYFDYAFEVTKSTQKSFIDAHIMRRYNGGEYYLLKKIVNDKSKNVTYQWYVDNLNSWKPPFNYVKSIGETNE